MTTTLNSLEQRVVLDNISWDLYEGLLLAHRDRSVPRFTYDRGCLEIMSPSSEHEQLKHAVAQLVDIVAEEKQISLKGFGSTTFRREDIARGFEPDACFYGENLRLVQGKAEIDLRNDPPPDLAIEIDIIKSSLDRLSIMAEAGIPELWRYNKAGWRILILQDGVYAEHAQSRILPGFTTETISILIEESRTFEPLRWKKRVRERSR